MIARTCLLRLSYLIVAIAWWIATAGGHLTRRPVTLCYHGVPRRHRRRFAQHAAILGRRTRVQVTFDDAFANLIDNALPALAAHHVPATVFVVTENLGGPPRWAMTPNHPDAGEATMTASDLRQLARRALVRFGSHTARHRALPALPAHEAWSELVRSRATLEEIVGRAVDEVAFPYGAWNRATLDLAARCGYRRLHALGTVDEPAPPGAEVIERLPVRADAWPIEIRLAADGAYAWLAGLRRHVRTRRPVAPAPAMPVPARSIAGRVGAAAAPAPREREAA